MYYYRDTKNTVHGLDSVDFEHLLPVGCVRISDVEAAALLHPPETLDAAKLRRIDALSTQCEAEIVSGFESSALGDPHLYQSDRDDQLNLVGAAATATAMPYKCQDGAGVWGYRLHTATQLAQVLTDGAARKLALLQRYTTLKEQVEAATDTAAVDAVVW